MATEVVEAIISGGKATAGPPLGPALGPKGVNMGQVIAEINKKTEAMKGMTVPVKVIIDTDTKQFTIEVGTPPTSALLKKEALLEKGSGKAKDVMVGDLKIDQIISIAKVKQERLLAQNLKASVKEVIGTCTSLGILVEGMHPRDAIKAVDEGKWDDKISGKTPLAPPSEEEKRATRAGFQAAIDSMAKKEEAAAATEKGAEKKEKAAKKK